MDGLLLTHVVATTMMAALIWFVQVVHYPLFRLVGEPEFTRFEREHTTRIAPIVLPLMGLEAVSGFALLVMPPPGIGVHELWIGAALIAGIWLSTATLQAPAHRRLVQGYDERALQRLVSTNWLQTALWSFRLILTLTWIP